MATAIGDLVVRLGAQTRDFDQKMGRTRRTLVAVGGAARTMAAAFGPISAGVLFAGAIRSGEQFNRKMRSSLAIMGSVSQAMRKDMRQAAFETARNTRFGASEAAEAFFFLASAGMDAKQSIAALPQVALFAQAGNFDLARATDLATDAQSAMGLSSKDAAKNLENLTRVTDVLIKANTLANASAEQFSEALTNKAAAALRTVGKEMEEGLAVLAAWADQGIKGAEAGTALNIVLRDLQTKALANKEAFAEARVAVFDKPGEMQNLADIVQQLEKHLGGMSDAMKKAALLQMGFTDKSIIFIQTLLGTSEKIRQYEKDLRQAGGTTKKVADEQLTPLQKVMAKLGATTTALGSSLMEGLTPALNTLGDVLARLPKDIARIRWGFLKLYELSRRLAAPMRSGFLGIDDTELLKALEEELARFARKIYPEEAKAPARSPEIPEGTRKIGPEESGIKKYEPPEVIKRQLSALPAWTELKAYSQQLTRAVMTPLERFREEAAKIESGVLAGFITQETAQRRLDELQKGLEPDEKAAKEDRRYAGALKKGSAEVYSRILASMGERGGQKSLEKATTETAGNTKQMVSDLQDTNAALKEFFDRERELMEIPG